jgi:hypothetical protein
MLTTRIILAMSGHDTLRPSSLDPSQSVYVILRATSHTQAKGMWPLHFKHSHLWKKSELVHVHCPLWLRNQQSKWMQDGCKVYMDSYMASNGSCFKVTWIIFKNHLLEVGLTQNRETISLPKPHNCWFIIFHHVWGPRMNRNSSKY